MSTSNELPVGRFQPRIVSNLGTWNPGDWSIKVYGITYEGERPFQSLIDAGQAAARTTLDEAERGAHYGLGFLGVHQGRDFDMVFLGWWQAENELQFQTFLAPSGQPDQLRLTNSSDPVACVWDLAVIAFERRAWLDAVLNADVNSQQDPRQQYLAIRLEGDV